MSDLTKKQAAFVREYLLDLNAKQAAIRAGYSPRSAEVEGSRLLRHPKVVEALARERKAIESRTGITPERVLTELVKIGFSDIRKVVAWRANEVEVSEDLNTGEPVVRAFNEVVLHDSATLDDATAAAIAEVSQTKDGAVKVKLYDKRAALVDIGRHLGMFNQGRPASPDGVAAGEDRPVPPRTGDDGWDGLLQ